MSNLEYLYDIRDLLVRPINYQQGGWAELAEIEMEI
jgi:hypothetical protein